MPLLAKGASSAGSTVIVAIRAMAFGSLCSLAYRPSLLRTSTLAILYFYCSSCRMSQGHFCWKLYLYFVTFVNGPYFCLIPTGLLFFHLMTRPMRWHSHYICIDEPFQFKEYNGTIVTRTSPTNRPGKECERVMGRSSTPVTGALKYFSEVSESPWNPTF